MSISTKPWSRDLFKHLISEATNYVAADYMRHANERRVHLDKALEFRRELHTSRQQLAAEQYKHVDMARELAEHNGAEGDLEADYQAASDHLNLVQTALRQQEKIERYEADLDELQIRLEEQNEVVAEAIERQEENEARAEAAELEVDELKIERYEADLDELQIRLEEQNEVVAEAIERQEENEARAEAAELEVDELKSQLADYQQALDVQQTRAIQYNQAIAALNRAKELCHLPDLTADSAAEWLETFQAKELEATEKMLSLEQKMSMAQTAHSQFEQAYQLVVAINGPLARNEAWDVARELLREGVDQRHLAEQVQTAHSQFEQAYQLVVAINGPLARNEAWDVARELLREGVDQRHLAEQVQPLRMRLSELEQRLREQQEAERLLADFCKRQGKNFDIDELEALHQELEARIASLSDSVSNAREERMALRQEQEQLQSRIQSLMQRAPVWLAAQNSLNQLSEQCGEEFTSSQDVTEYLQQLLEREREAIVERDEVGARKNAVDEEIERLSQPGGSEDQRLNALAERFGGVLLSEIYDDVSLEDAPYFSALYGPSRHAIVVPDLSQVTEHLEGLTDCPEDLYLIEGDPQSFDDSVFSVDELEKAVVVKIADRQWRYSRFPEVPLFGRAARESRIESLHAEREVLSERFATLSFDVQKTQRLHQAFSRFIGSHLAVAFESDPEAEIRQLNSRRVELERALSNHENDNQQQRIQFEQAKEGVTALNRILPRLNLLADDSLADRVDEIRERLDEAQEAARFVQQFVNQLSKLEQIVSVLQSDPEQFEQLKEDYAYSQQMQRDARQQAFALTEVVQRRAHFSYSDSAEMLSGNSDL